MRHNYLAGRIDYENLDVTDLMAQVRNRARGHDNAAGELPEVLEQRARARLRVAVDLDDHRPYDLQKALQLQGSWNVTPQDLVESRRRGSGSILSLVRRAARPFLKLFANFELPLYKQFKINLGVADLLHELVCRNAELEACVERLSRRLEELEAERPSNGSD